MNTENYKNEPREAKKMCRANNRAHVLKVLEGMEEANERNEATKFCTIANRMKEGYQPRTSVCKDRDNNLIGNDRLIMEIWKQ